MATTVYNRCGYVPELTVGGCFFESALADSCGDRLCWNICLQGDGTFSVENGDSHFAKKHKYEMYNFHTIREAVQWCRIKDLERLLAKAQEDIEILKATAGSGEALAAKESPDVGNVRST